MSNDQRLRQSACSEIEKYKEVIEQDPYRLQYHVMPPVGLLNDPNGFIQWNGTYHLFYQWMPFKTGHGAKFWGHYSSKDLVNWKHEEIALTPFEWYEKNGCYSGSAIEHDGNMYIFYTGNVKDEQGNRESYQCLAVSNDGIHFDKKGPILELPKGYTAHFRDPKVWKENGHYFMVVGAQTDDLKGAVVLFRSENLVDWTHMGILVGGGKDKLGNFGYMFECPDLFQLDGESVLIFSPQGLESSGMKYQNVYQAGYMIGRFDSEEGTYEYGDFDELDRGFDFYAPQTTEDQQGRRLLFAWMSVPDQKEQDHPTIENQWLHNMTIPRELKLVNGKVWQVPIEELEGLRVGEAVEYDIVLDRESRQLEDVSGKAVELILDNMFVTEGWFDISIGGAARLLYSADHKTMTLERQSYVDGETEKRQCQLEELKSLHIYIDTSSIEAFINKGEQTFTARFYPAPNNNSIRFSASKNSKFTLKKWGLAKTF